MATDSFDWSIKLPEKQYSSFSGANRIAKLSISSEAYGDEELSIPKAVAKELEKKSQSSNFSPSSRNELLYELQQIEQKHLELSAQTRISKKDYSVKEFYSKFKQESYPSNLIDTLIERYKEVGLLDDMRYAESFISRKLSINWGPKKIEQELRIKGIDVADIEGWPDRFFEEESEFDKALALARRKHLNSKDPYAQLLRFLASRGFSYSVAKDVAKSILSQDTEF